MEFDKNLTGLLEKFPLISLEEMDGVKLMDRTDTKFVLRKEQLPGILEQIHGAYRLLGIGDNRFFTYNSLYFDTRDFKMYLDHHKGKGNRFKVRYREYVETKKIFLEVKRKTNKKRTVKKRTSATSIKEKLSTESMKFIRQQISLNNQGLEPKLWTFFRRFTLVHHSQPERITVDTGLKFSANGQTLGLPELVIIEVKQGRQVSNTEIISSLRQEKIHAMGMSKYCTGCIYLYPELKFNRFKRKLRTLNKLSQHDLNLHPPAGRTAIVRN